MNSKRRLVVYVDVDDTLVRSAGTKRMPIPSVVAHVKELAKADAELYCWSTVGAEYARSTARELGIGALFVAFLPKPNVLIDDQDIGTWKRFTVVPNEAIVATLSRQLSWSHFVCFCRSERRRSIAGTLTIQDPGALRLFLEIGGEPDGPVLGRL